LGAEARLASHVIGRHATGRNQRACLATRNARAPPDRQLGRAAACAPGEVAPSLLLLAAAASRDPTSRRLRFFRLAAVMADALDISAVVSFGVAAGKLFRVGEVGEGRGR